MALARWQRTIQDGAGNALGSAFVEVRLQVTGLPLATIYSDRDGTTPMSNPFQADSEGFAAFHVQGGAYKIRAYKTVDSQLFERIWTWVGIGTNAETDFGTVFVPRGPWSDSPTEYSIGDVVSHEVGGVTYAFVSNENTNIGNEPQIIGSPLLPVSDAHWTVLGLLEAPGTPGADGATGATGPAGPNAGLDYQFNTATSGDPGSGYIRFNNATPASITSIAFSDVDRNSTNQEDLLQFLDGSDSTIKATLLIVDVADRGNWVALSLDAAFSDQTGYWTANVTYVDHGGSIANDTIVSILFSRTGDKGDTGATGSTGSTGSPGSDGADGTSAGVVYNFDSSTSMADPGTGDLRLNNATLASVTAAAVSDLCGESGNPDASAWILSFDDSTSAIKGFLFLHKQSAPENFVIFAIGSLTDNSGWTQLALTHIASNGSFSNTDVLTVNFSRNGDKGDTGDQGPQGDPGSGSGNVNTTGAPVTAGHLVQYNDTSGNVIEDSGIPAANVLIDSDIGVAVQGYDADLAAIAALSPTNDDVIQRKAGAWTNRSMAQLIADLAALATTFQPLDSDLTSWAAITRASGFDTFVATPSCANLASLLTDDLFQLDNAALNDLRQRWTAASASGPAGLAFFEDTDNGSNKITLSAPSSIASDKAVAFQDNAGTLALIDVENQALTGGATVTEKDLGTVSSGTTTLDMGDRPIQKYTNNGAHTLAPGSTVGMCLVVITNGASAGAITTSGWTKVAGDSFTTTNGHKFVCHCSVSAVGSLLVVQKMQ